MFDNLFVLLVLYSLLVSSIVHICLGLMFIDKLNCAQDNNVYSCSLKYEYKWVPNE
jgi:hypothetical protein